MLLGCVATTAMMPLAGRADTIIDGGQVVTYPPSPPAFSDALTIGKVGNGTVNLNSGATVQMNTANGSTNSRIELGNGAGSTGTLNVDGGTLTVNIAPGTAPAGTSIGRVWVGGGLNNTTGGTGVLNMSSGLIEFVNVTTPSTNYGGLAIGRGTGVQGTLNQTGGTIRLRSIEAVDLGTQGGTGNYTLSNNAVLDASTGGMTMYVGSRKGTGGQVSSGTLTIADNARLTMTSGTLGGGQLYVGDAGATGTIHQTGAGSVVTLGVTNSVLFGSNVNNAGTNGGSGTYRLDAGTLNVLNGSGSDRLILGSNTGGSGTLQVTGGTANIATAVTLGSVVGSTGLIDQTGGTVSFANGGRLVFGSGTGTYNLTGGTLAISGTNGISGSTGTLNLGAATLRVQGSDLTTSHTATLVDGTTFTLDTNGLNAALSGALSGSGALVKSGTGTLTLSGNNSSYTGAVSLQQGTLALTAANGLNTGNAVTTATGTNLDLTGLAAAAVVNIGALSGAGTVKLGDSYLVSTIGSGESAAFSGTIISDAYGYQANYGRFRRPAAAISSSTVRRCRRAKATSSAAR